MSDQPSPPSLGALFLGFLMTGVCGFGGVLPWARRTIVERRRWLSAAEFTELLGLCQFLPGPNVINLSVALGARFHGIAGAAAALSGLMAAPMAIVIALGFAYGRLAHIPAVSHAFQGLSAVAAALVLATALKIAAPLQRRPLGLLMAALTFAGMTMLHVPLPLVILSLAPISVLLAWRVESPPAAASGR